MAQSSSSTVRHPPPLSEALFLEGLRHAAGEEVETLTNLSLTEARAHGLEVDGQASAAGPILKYNDDTGEFFSFGQIRGDGKFGSSNRLSAKCVVLGLPQEIWRDYDDVIIRFIPGSKKKQSARRSHVLSQKHPPAGAAAQPVAPEVPPAAAETPDIIEN
jgi:hypothetical protein